MWVHVSHLLLNSHLSQVRWVQACSRRHWSAWREWRRRRWERHAQLRFHDAAIDMQAHFATQVSIALACPCMSLPPWFSPAWLLTRWSLQLHFSEWKILWAKSKSGEAGQRHAENERALQAAVRESQRALIEERAKAHEVATDIQSLCALNRKLERHLEEQARSEQQATAKRDRARQREALLAHMHAIERVEESKRTAQLHAHIATLHHVVARLTAVLQDLERDAQLALEAAHSIAFQTATAAASIRTCETHKQEQMGIELGAVARARNQSCLRQCPQTPTKKINDPSPGRRNKSGDRTCSESRGGDRQPQVQDSIQWTAVQQAHLKLLEAKTLKSSPRSIPIALQVQHLGHVTGHCTVQHRLLLDASIDKSPRMLRFRKLLDYQASPQKQAPTAPVHGRSFPDTSETPRPGQKECGRKRQPLGTCVGE